MAWRCTADQVESLLRDYDETIDLTPFITTANVLTSRLSARDTESVLSSRVLAEIEKYLSAYFYTYRDPQTTEEQTADASGKFQERDYLHVAKMLDETGNLAKMLAGSVHATLQWLGKVPSDQTDYVDRD
jgi:hypothetical protein